MQLSLRFIVIGLLFLSLQVTAQRADTNNQIPSGWHHLDFNETGYFGVSTEKAYHYLDSLKLPSRKIVVAVIDADLDVNHEDLKNQIWENPNPSDKGYQNDINGWNFLGTSDGYQLTKVGTESFREYKRLKGKFEGKTIEDFKRKKDKEEFAYFQQVKKDAKISSYIKFGEYAGLTWMAFEITDSLVKANGLTSTATVADVIKLEVEDSKVKDYFNAATASLWKYKEKDLWQHVYNSQKAEYELVMKRIQSLDDPSSPRDTIGDNVNSIRDRFYGNENLYDSTSYHGTFVSGIIGATRGNNLGIDGIADYVEIMGVRAVPDGDEYDKDVALAIRYAVDHGANIINMSFGKYFSPESKWVQKAIRYAISNNVLLVHAAGNDKRNIDSVRIYPSLSPKYTKQTSFIRVGASTPEGSAAAFSNYGKNEVDLFAPGFQIYSTTLNDSYAKANGTSFSAPVVTGIAALIWSYFPDYSAKELKDILIKSVVSDPNGTLKDKSVNGGIINALKAVKIARGSS